MSTLLVPWLVFPLVLVALSWGCGLLLERAVGHAAARAARRPLRLRRRRARRAVRGADGRDGRARDACRHRGRARGLRARPRRGAACTWTAGRSAPGVGAFAAYAAPIVLSGAATFAGYIKLDDDSTLLALVDRAMEHGRNIAGLDLSTYLRVARPAARRGLSARDRFCRSASAARSSAATRSGSTSRRWRVMAAMLALGLYAARRARRPGRAGCAPSRRSSAAQSALLYGYALWGGIKELGTAWALPVLAALVPLAARSERLRHLMPLAAVSALLLGVLNAGALVWLAPALGCAARRSSSASAASASARARRLRPSSASWSPSRCRRSSPRATSCTRTSSASTRSRTSARRSSPLQLAGIWPVGDFRADPELGAATRC